ncbi:MAG TPA: TetR/AcrR family transcriptional regulator [Bacteroidia bacterium]
MVRGKIGDKKVAIYQAALRRVNKNGYGGLTMQELAKDAKLATGTVYLYFENKEDLVNELIINTKEEMVDAIYDGLDLEEPLFPFFKKMVSNYLEYGINNLDKIIFLEQFYRSEFITSQTKLALTEIWEPFRNQLISPKNEMLLKDGNRDLMLKNFEGGINQIIKTIKEHNLVYNKLMRDQILDVLWCSIRR